MSDRSTIRRSQLTVPSRRAVLMGSVAGGGLLLGSGRTAHAASLRRAPARREIRMHRISGLRWFSGRGEGVRTDLSGLRLNRPTGRRQVTEPGGVAAEWEYGSWTSADLPSGFDVTELIASWTASTPGRSWIEVQVQARTTGGERSPWLVLGRWCRFDPEQGGGIKRHSLEDQPDEIASIYTDTLAARSGTALRDVKLRVLLMRPVGSKDTPTVHSLSAVATRLPDEETVQVSGVGPARGRVLGVPAYSQELHVGQYPQWDNGGEAWCSPTSTSMIADYWKRGPNPRELSWVQPMTDPQVAYAARNTYDYVYEGCGNWPFNIAYAGGLGLDGYVTRLRSLREAEPFILAGVPLVLSVSFEKDELDGAGYGTNGHLMVLRGFDRAGNPVMNDPASHLIASNDEVKVTYRRDQLENAWVPHSGGTTYVILPRR